MLKKIYETVELPNFCILVYGLPLLQSATLCI